MEAVRLVIVDALSQPGTPAFAKYGGATINVYTTELAEQAAYDLWQARRHAKLDGVQQVEFAT